MSIPVRNAGPVHSEFNSSGELGADRLTALLPEIEALKAMTEDRHAPYFQLTWDLKKAGADHYKAWSILFESADGDKEMQRKARDNIHTVYGHKMRLC